MCAINGFNFDDRALAERMNGATRHRGPDGTGVAVFSECTLGHDRLAVIDLSDDAAQPMRTPDGRFTIVFNGEIYNFLELRRALEGRYQFRTHSDTEVLLALWAEEGAACLTKLNGIFAFAVWDDRDKTLSLVRDAHGVKPLYYSWDGKRLVFSSEAKGLLEALSGAELDRDALPLYLSLGYVPAPYSMFCGIRKLEAGAAATLKGREFEMVRWRRSDVAPWTGSREEAAEEIRRRASEAVRRQMVSDRPVGVFLSGGIDSTALASLAAALTDEPLRTYSTRFDFGVPGDRFNGDADLAARTARRFGARHTETLATAREMIDAFDRLTWHLDEPHGNPSSGAVFLLAARASEDVAVLLTGDGPDELFGGYPRYEASRLITWSRLAPASLRHVLASALRPVMRPAVGEKLLVENDADHYLSLWASKASDASAVRSYFQERYFAGPERTRDFENRMMEVDRRTWLADEALLRNDKCLAAWGVEGRVPFLDDELVRLAESIPSGWKLRAPWQRLRQGKRIWVDALRDLLPEEVLMKEKTGWFAPMAKWLREPYVYGIVRDRLGALPRTVADPGAAVRLLDDHKEKRGYHLQSLWILLSLSAWLDKFQVRT